MFTHYLKIAVRNLKKYKLQSVISIIGLSLGFVCFTLSMIWIRYEMTYDSFHKDADLIYRVRTVSPSYANGLSPITSYALAGYLKKNFPEIQSACSVNGSWKTEMTVDGKKTDLFLLRADSAFLETFSIPLLAGNKSALESQSKGYAISAEAARKLFGNENPIGKEINNNKGSVEALLGGWGKHSNLYFDIITPIEPYKELNVSSCQTYIKLHKGVNKKAFVEKISQYEDKREETTVKGLVLTPITRLHFDKPDKENNVKFDHVFLFAVCAGLVILCSLFNFLTLLVSRIQMRSKELALRKVNGASNRSLLSLLGMEVVVTLLCTFPLGIIIIEGVLPAFLELSGMQNREGGIYLEVFLYAGIIVCIAYLFALVPIHYFRSKTLHNAIHGGKSGHSRNLFRKGSILIQLIISIGFIFCTSVLIKQIHHFNHMDIGMERKNIATLRYFSRNVEFSTVVQEIKQIPFIAEAIGVHFGLFPQMGRMSQGVTDWDDKQPDMEPISLETVNGSREFVRFYNFTFIKGGLPGENEDINDCVVINEAALKKFGWEDPIGKKYSNTYTVVGVIRDYYNQSPTMPSHPVAILLTPSNAHNSNILYKYAEGQKDSSTGQIKKMFEEKFPGTDIDITDMETEYAKFMQSENYLLLLLGFVSGVCILVSIFGIYSLSSLTVEEKRKEIAVRKVNGASVGKILLLFFREYLLLLCIAATVAFPIGYIIMRSWIQNYVKQTDISAWLYIAIFLLTGIIIACSVISCIWKAAKINPAEIIKNE